MPYDAFAALTDVEDLVQIYGFCSERDRDVWVATFTREAEASGLTARPVTVQGPTDAYSMLEYVTDAGS